MNRLPMLAVLVAVPLAAGAETPPPAEGATVRTKIEALDPVARLVTLTKENGEREMIYAGPEIKRFDELKVGDTVTCRFRESVARLRKPSRPGPAAGPKIVRSQGPKPGGTSEQQVTALVMVKSLDARVPAVTVVGEDGRAGTFRVEDARELSGLRAGDRVEITYTRAVMIAVE
jgi:hypothetical protein